MARSARSWRKAGSGCSRSERVPTRRSAIRLFLQVLLQPARVSFFEVLQLLVRFLDASLGAQLFDLRVPVFRRTQAGAGLAVGCSRGGRLAGRLGREA